MHRFLFFQKKKVRIFFEDSLDTGRGRTPQNTVDYSHYVTHFDVQLLCMTATNDDDRGVYRGLSLPWRQYIAVLSANLCGTDAELAVSLLTEHNLREENPLLALQSLAIEIACKIDFSELSEPSTGTKILLIILITCNFFL